MRNILLVLVATAIASTAWQQGHAQSCFLSADFEDGIIPAGWANSIVSIVSSGEPVSYTHLRAHETVLDLVCRLLLEKKKLTSLQQQITCVTPHTHTKTI